jgi:protein-S-isoprenylcysteine O-methyltransferase Ste14
VPAHLPTLLIGLLIAAYWARVLRLAHKTRRRTGRAANLFPTEPLGRLLRIIWFPTVAAWIAIPCITFARQRRLPAPLTPLYDIPSVAWVALAVAVAAFAATLICWKRMGKSWRMGIAPGEHTDLIVTGPYAYVRHPIYALSCLLAICTFLIVPSPVMGIIAAVHISLLVWESAREEQHMISVHGDAYARYAVRVGRFLPTRIALRHISDR